MDAFCLTAWFVLSLVLVGLVGCVFFAGWVVCLVVLVFCGCVVWVLVGLFWFSGFGLWFLLVVFVEVCWVLVVCFFLGVVGMFWFGGFVCLLCGCDVLRGCFICF